MPTLHSSEGSEKALRALKLYDAAMVTHSEEALHAYAGSFHDGVELTVGCSGMAVALSGLGELRAAMENLFAAGLSYACHDARVVSEQPGRVVTHYTRVLSVDGTPLSEVEAENEIAFEGDLICRMTIRERAGPAEAPVVWAPLGSRPCFAGEIAAHRSAQKLLARLDDGRAIELPAAASANGRWETGDPVIVFFDGQAPLGWYLPDRQFGVDLRELGDR